ncbi:hypothetical protein M9Y10_003057 [Tritrichomonas musculus]|uniref:Uncharacterized protein n=1 Tax=Tritrichomonas musculus TaxID=1915356 RepID=A0ABR2JPR2_9EUKA
MLNITDFKQQKTEEEEEVEIFASELEKKIINMVIGCNIAFLHIDKLYFIKLLNFLGISDREIPTSYSIRRVVKAFSNQIYKETYSDFHNSIVSLVVDGSTSWTTNFYEFALFSPGKIKHIKLL